MEKVTVEKWPQGEHCHDEADGDKDYNLEIMCVTFVVIVALVLWLV